MLQSHLDLPCQIPGISLSPPLPPRNCALFGVKKCLETKIKACFMFLIVSMFVLILQGPWVRRIPWRRNRISTPVCLETPRDGGAMGLQRVGQH